ncbi:MAG: dihydroorotate dehydrogenase electron transfer subunit [Thermoplasmata archaeon]
MWRTATGSIQASRSDGGNDNGRGVARGKGPLDAGNRTTLRVVRITGKRRETPLVTVLRYFDSSPASPGQFVMVWVPGVDEIPMSLCHIGPLKGIAVHVKGEATEALAGLEPGDRVGIRGPLGRGFEPLPGRALVIAGGTGIAALSPLIELLPKKRRHTVVIGARTASELLFVKRVLSAGAEVVVTTEDGSAGMRGMATDAAEELLQRGGYARIYTCGPELMMRRVAELGAQRGIPVQLSLERYMKCGIGLCDACAISGLHVCTDGPVVSGQTALTLSEFGKSRRDASGRREEL